MKNRIIISFLGLTLLGYASEFYYENGKKVTMTEIASEGNQKIQAEDAVRYYKTDKGHKLGVKQDILVECKEGVDCQKVLSKYETVSINALTDSIFIVKVAKDENVFVFSQKLYENSDIKIAHPNFIKEKKRR
jgi:hypothetical protein